MALSSLPIWATPNPPQLFRAYSILPVAAGSKKRISDDKVIIDSIVGDVSGKDVIILDDEIANGGTIVEILQHIRARGVGRIFVACTHGLFTGKAIERLRQQTDVEEIVTDKYGTYAP